MAKPLVLQCNGHDFACFPEKVDRSKLYGFVESEVLDTQGRKCILATLGDDGKTVIEPGGTAFAQLSIDGEWLDKTAMKPVDLEGKPIIPVQSTYNAPVPLTKKASVEEYMNHAIKGAYILRSDGDISELVNDLKSGTIYTFPYSFRGGLEADVAFLIAAADGTPFLCVGAPANIQFVGLEQAAPVIDEDADEDEEDDEVDFSMM